MICMQDTIIAKKNYHDKTLYQKEKGYYFFI